MARPADPPAGAGGRAAERQVEALLGDAAALRRLLSDERAVAALAADPPLLRRLLTDARSRDVLLDDRNLLRRVLADPRSTELLCAEPPLLRRLFPDPRFHAALLADDKLLQRLLADSRSRTVLFGDRALAAKAVDDPRARAALLRNRQTLRAALADFRLVDSRDLADRVAAVALLRGAWERLRRYAPTERGDLNAALAAALTKIRHPNDVKHALLDILCDDATLYLSGAALRFAQRATLWTILQEILVAEEYYFESDETHPVILDCGTNFGLSLYYFKTLFPRAEIIAFEPEPALRGLACANVAANGFADIEVLPFALAAQEGEAELFVPELDSLGATLDPRGGESGGRRVAVPCVPLSGYLKRPVDFLKLDIEGAEAAVLAECADRLPLVRQLYCEYHQGGERTSGRLATILAILDRAGFDTTVAKSQNQQSQSAWRPMTHLNRPYSASIWARNRRNG